MMNFLRSKLSYTIIGFILLVIITAFALITNDIMVLAVIALLLLPIYVIIILRLIIKMPIFISVQIAFGCAFLVFAFVSLLESRIPSLQDFFLLLFIIPSSAIYTIAAITYLLLKEKYKLLKTIVLLSLVLVGIVISCNWWLYEDEPIDIYLAGILVIYVWFSLVPIIYLNLRRKQGIGKSVSPLIINIICLSAIWIVVTLMSPVEYLYRYSWRQNDFNVIVQRIEAGEIKPNIYREITLPDRYLYLAYDGWVTAETRDNTWAIYFYDSPGSGYIYREDGKPIDALDCGTMKRINENWFYCHP